MNKYSYVREKLASVNFSNIRSPEHTFVEHVFGHIGRAVAIALTGSARLCADITAPLPLRPHGIAVGTVVPISYYTTRYRTECKAYFKLF